ncbi:Cystathionine beta-synthase [Aphelenchoides fujianensis]|nr:Cystathionine beta-synthase [Aphelenchoides fujianensis]
MYVDTSNRICSSITETIGHTPLVYLHSVTQGLEAKIAVKLEWVPCTSTSPARRKDRVGVYMIEKAVQEGRLKPGSVIIEPTSGNSGIALAAACAAKKFKLILVMSSGMSLERRTLLRAYGAQVVLTPAELGVQGSDRPRSRAEGNRPEFHHPESSLSECFLHFNRSFFADPNNVAAHYEGTGPEIWQQTAGQVDVFCAGVGTGKRRALRGTLSGVGKFLKEKKPAVKIFAVEPVESAVLAGKPAGPHLIVSPPLFIVDHSSHQPGIGIGSRPANLLPVYEGIIGIRSMDAVEMARRLALEEGILAGISAGANVLAAIELARLPENKDKDKLIVTTIPDFGECAPRRRDARALWPESQTASCLADDRKKYSC